MVNVGKDECVFLHVYT